MMLSILLLTVQALILSTGDPTVPETEPDIGKLIEHIEKQIQHVQDSAPAPAADEPKASEDYTIGPCGPKPGICPKYCPSPCCTMWGCPTSGDVSHPEAWVPVR